MSVSGAVDENQTDIPSKDIHYRYDVFLSFRGEDTRKGFTGHLFGALDQMGVNTFVDSEELHKGEEISDTLMRSIKKSRIAIIVFSKRYATSHWCLDEATMIMDCKKSKGQKVLPVFYYVDPCDVRNQKGSYDQAFAAYGNKWKNKIKRWRVALKEAGTLSGYTLDGQQEYPVIQQIVKEVLFLLNHNPLHVPTNLVGMQTHLEKMEKLLNMEEKEVHMVGIYETGGSGKTTIAKSIYNKIANQFTHHGFLANVRETCQASSHGLLQLQQTLFSQVMRDNYSKIVDVNKGVSMIKNRLGDKKTLLVIDDVDELKQLEMLAGAPGWFGARSRIIITTRDESILKNHNVKHVYKVPLLDPEDAKQLFIRILCLDENDKEKVNEEDLLTELVNCTGCLPLAVRVLASSLRGKDKEEWRDTLKKMKKKIIDRKVFETLYVSYESLGDDDVKSIFLDIACFFKGQPVEYVRKALESCGFHPDSGIEELISKSLIFIKHDKIDMHKVVQEMGWWIVRQESPHDPSKHSRLWIKDEILQVLSENTGTEKIEGIKLEFEASEKGSLNFKAFKKMKDLRLFIAHNAIHSGTQFCFPDKLRYMEWPEYSLQSLPLNHKNKKITALNMSKSSLSKVDLLHFSILKFIKFNHCTSLESIPDLSSVPNLQSLDVEECTNLSEVDSSLGSLKKLVHLNFLSCRKVHTFALYLRSENLRDLILKGCFDLRKFPEIKVEMKLVTRLCLNKTAINELPESIEKFVELKDLYLENCRNLERLPSSIYKLKALQRVCLGGCLELKEFPEHKDHSAFPELIYLGLWGCGLQEIGFIEKLSCHSKLKSLDLSKSKIVTIPAGLSQFNVLQQLNLTECEQLQCIQGLPPNVKYLSAKGCGSLEQCVPLSDILKPGTQASPCIKRMDFAGCDKLTEHLRTMADMLSTLDLFGDSQIRILHPGGEIPKWFDHKSIEGCLSFSINTKQHQNIVGLAFCVAIEFNEQNTSVSCEMQIYINSQIAYVSNDYFLSMDSNHMWFHYVPCAMIWEWDAKMQNGYNQLKVLFEVSPSTLKSCAVHLVLNKDRQINESPKPMYLQTSMMTSVYRSSPTSLDRALRFASSCMVFLFFLVVFSFFWPLELGGNSHLIHPT